MILDSGLLFLGHPVYVFIQHTNNKTGIGEKTAGFVDELSIIQSTSKVIGWDCFLWKGIYKMWHWWCKPCTRVQWYI